jgi:hypothetical protein
MCRSVDTVTRNCVFLCQCHSSNDVNRTLQLYHSCQKDKRAKLWSFQVGNGLLDLREHWTEECLQIVVVVCFRELTVVVWSSSRTAEGPVWPRQTEFCYCQTAGQTVLYWRADYPTEYTQSLLYARLFYAFQFSVPCQFTQLLNLRPPISCLTLFDRLRYVTSSPYLWREYHLWFTPAFIGTHRTHASGPCVVV